MDICSVTAEGPSSFSTYWIPFTVWFREIPLKALGCDCEICWIGVTEGNRLGKNHRLRKRMGAPPGAFVGKKSEPYSLRDTGFGVQLRPVTYSVGWDVGKKSGPLFPAGHRVWGAALPCDLQGRLG